MSITVYTKPACPQCETTKRALKKANLEFVVVDFTKDPSALEMIKEKGFKEAPVVHAGDDWWSGFRPDLIKDFAEKTI